MICKGCKTEFTGNYCPSCGRPASADDIQPGYQRKPANVASKVGKFFAIFGCVVLALFVLLVIAAVATDDDSTASNSSETKTASSDKEKNNTDSTDKVYGIGDTVTLDYNDDGTYELKITKVERKKCTDDYDNEEHSSYVIIEYEYKNIDCKQDIVVSYPYFRAYDKNGNQLDVNFFADTKSPNTISAGGKKKASMAYYIDSKSNYIKLQFYNIDYEDLYSPCCTFKLKW